MSTIIILATTALLAQSNYQSPDLKVEVFGGFSTAAFVPGRVNDQNLDRLRLNGWAAGITSFQTFRRWGLAAEVGRRNHGDAEAQSWLFGGNFRALARPRFALTGRIMAGVERWEPVASRAGGYGTQNSFTFGFGQALDFKLNERIALRVRPEIFLVRREAPDGSRRLELVNPFSAGLVFRFGQR